MSEAVEYFATQAHRVPLMTAAEELHLGALVREWLDTPEPSKQQVRAGRRARDRMIQSNLRMVLKLTAKYTSALSRDASLSKEDLLMEGVIGLTRGVEKFDPARGYKFSTYGYWWIRQGMTRCIIKSGCIRPPTSAADLLLKYRKKPESVTNAEFAEEVGITLERLERELMQANRANTQSLDRVVSPTTGGGLTSLSELQSDPRDMEAYVYAQIEAQERLAHLESLLPDELAIIDLHEHHGHEGVAEVLDLGRMAAMNRIKSARLKVKKLAKV